jgi:predicted DNA-binding transcriptional regulator AlpA
MTTTDRLRASIEHLPDSASLTLPVATLRGWLSAEIPTEPAAPAEGLLTASEVAGLLGMSVKWIYANAARLGAMRLSPRAVRFKRPP